MPSRPTAPSPTTTTVLPGPACAAPIAAEVTLAYEELAITAEPGLVLLIYTAEPGSPSAERLQLLASWAATTGPADRSPTDPVGRSSRDTEGT